MKPAADIAESVWICETAWKDILAVSARHLPLETGGMLIGYEAESGDPVVTSIIGPGPKARHGRFRFKPDYDYQQELLDSRFRQTAGRETYLGDWHTHPSGECALSRRDVSVLRRIASCASAGTRRPIMLVLVPSDHDWTACTMRLITRGRLRRAKLQPLTRRLFSDEYRVPEDEARNHKSTRHSILPEVPS